MSKRTSMIGWLGAAATIAAVSLPAAAQARFAPPDTGPPIVPISTCQSTGHQGHTRMNAVATYVDGAPVRVAHKRRNAVATFVDGAPVRAAHKRMNAVATYVDGGPVRVAARRNSRACQAATRRR